MFYRFRYFRQARQLQLPAADKATMRREVLSFMETHPLRGEGSVRMSSVPATTSWTSFFAPVLRPVPLMALLLILIGGGTVSAAENALPDSPLYVVKTQVTEPVRRSFAFSAEAKADVEARFAARRLEEAETLAKADRLTPTLQVNAQTQFALHADRVAAQMMVLNAAGQTRIAANVASRFENTLQAHTLILTQLANETDIQALLEAVRVKTTAVANARAALAADQMPAVTASSTAIVSPTSTVSSPEQMLREKQKTEAEQLQTNVERSLNEVQELLGAIPLSNKTTLVVQARASFAEANQLSIEARAAYTRQDYAGSIQLNMQVQAFLQLTRDRIKEAQKRSGQITPVTLPPADQNILPTPTDPKTGMDTPKTDPQMPTDDGGKAVQDANTTNNTDGDKAKQDLDGSTP